MTRPLLSRVLDQRIQQTEGQIEALSRFKRELERRRRALSRHPLTDHGRGHCACFEEEGQNIPLSRLLPVRVRVGAHSGTNARRRGERAPR